MTNDVIPLLKFTPSAQHPDVLETITVQREPLVSALVESALDTDGGLRHQLLIGPRGIGKSHVMSLVASRLHAADASADAVVVAWLDEDPWTVRNYDKLLASIVARIAAVTDDAELMRDAASLRSAGGTIAGLEGEELIRLAAGTRRVVLLIENLDEIFRRIGPDGQARLRAFAENWSQLLVMATSPQLFAGVQRHTSPFYGFFAVTYLDELTLDSAAELLRRIARLRGEEELVRFLDTEMARRRLAAIEALAGGHPRVWLLLAGCISIAAIDDLVPLFLEALDDLTPYYQDRLRELGDQEQEVVALLSEDGGALSNRTLAERSGLGENRVSTMLRRLADRGYVRRAMLRSELGDGDKRMSFWELREPLMRLCLDVKQARGGPLRIVVDFLRAWYGSALLDELGRLPPSAHLATTYASEAFRTLDAPLEGVALLRGSAHEIIARAERGLSLLPDKTSLQVAKATGLMMEGHLEEAKELYEQVLATHSKDRPNLALQLQVATVRQRLGEPVDMRDLLDAIDRESALDPDDAAKRSLAALACEFADRHDDAISRWQEAIALEPDDADFHEFLSFELDQVGRYEEALVAAAEAARINPDEVGLHHRLGNAFTRLQRHDEAAAAYEQASERAPDDPRYHHLRSLALNSAGRYEEMLSAVERACELDPTSHDYLETRGIALSALGRHDEALADFAHAIALAPTHPSYHHRHGLELGRLGRGDEALASLTRAAELDPKRPAYLRALGSRQARLGHHADAVVTFERAAALDPADHQSIANRGVALLHLGRDEEALEAFTHAIEVEPTAAGYHGDRALILGRQQRYAEALEASDRAVELDPSVGLFYSVRGVTLANLGRPEDALSAFARSIELDATRKAAHFSLALVLADLGRDDEAVDAFARAIALEPGDVRSHHLRGRALARLSRGEEALAEFQSASALDPRDAGVANSRANLLVTLGRLEEAELEAWHAITLDATDAVLRFTLVEAVLARGEGDRALPLLREALAVWSQKPTSRPGDTDLLCAILWDRYRETDTRAALLATVASAYDEAGCVEDLSRGIVSSVSLFIGDDVPLDDVDSWVEDWSAAASIGALGIPIAILNAARAWKRDRDRAHLLALPREQRDILVALITRSGTVDGLDAE